MQVAKITVNDVEELSQSVEPWRMQMCQLSAGKLHAEMHIAQLQDMFISDEYWSRKINGTGQTPPGYLTLAGPIRQAGFSWCGASTSPQLLAYTLDSREIDFQAIDGEHHWTLLIPMETAREYLGAEFLEESPRDQTHLEADPRLISKLSSTVVDSLTSLRTWQAAKNSYFSAAEVRARILAAASQLLLSASESCLIKPERSSRSTAYRKARQLIESLNRPISVPELAEHVGVSRRTLEVAFREATGFSPKAFMLRARLNALHRELRRVSSISITVTQAAQNCGFTELGRTAGYYRDMFGESPSDTLSKDSEPIILHFSDLLGARAH